MTCVLREGIPSVTCIYSPHIFIGGLPPSRAREKVISWISSRYDIKKSGRGGTREAVCSLKVPSGHL